MTIKLQIIEIKPHHQMFIFNLLNNLEIYVLNGDMHLVYTHNYIKLYLNMPMNYVRYCLTNSLYPKHIFVCKITETFASWKIFFTFYKIILLFIFPMFLDFNNFFFFFYICLKIIHVQSCINFFIFLKVEISLTLW